MDSGLCERELLRVSRLWGFDFWLNPTTLHIPIPPSMEEKTVSWHEWRNAPQRLSTQSLLTQGGTETSVRESSLH